MYCCVVQVKIDMYHLTQPVWSCAKQLFEITLFWEQFTGNETECIGQRHILQINYKCLIEFDVFSIPKQRNDSQYFITNVGTSGSNIHSIRCTTCAAVYCKCIDWTCCSYCCSRLGTVYREILISFWFEVL